MPRPSGEIPGPLYVDARSGRVQLIHGGERYAGPVALTDQGVELFAGPDARSVVDALGHPFDAATHGVARWWLTQRGYTLDTQLGEVVLPGGAHLVRDPALHGSPLKELW